MDGSHSLNRRTFLKWAGVFTASTVVGSTPLAAFAQDHIVRLTVLHTNDVHSRIEPFPMDGGKYQGLGGVARRATLVERIRKEQRNVLLLDAGDMVQGTPYFNLFGGKVEMELMSKMGYDAATLGNHDFDNGPDGLRKMLEFAQFPILVANYDCNNTALHGKIQAYTIFKKQGLRIGVFGLGIHLNGLVDPRHYQDIHYQDPISIANQTALQLKHEHKCHFIICLSHLGHRYQHQQVSDTVLAKETRHIDLIIGGHTHTFMTQPEIVSNLDSRPTIINQVGFGGINLGRLDFVFDRRKAQTKLIAARPYLLSDTLG